MTFTIKSTVPMDGEAVLPLDDAKDHLRVLSDDEDALIEILRDAAIDWVERHTGCALMVRTFEYSGTGFPCTGRSLPLPVRPVVSVEAVSYLDGAGAVIALAAPSFRIAQDSLNEAAGARWPVTLAGAGTVTVEFTAGFADIYADAPALVSAVKLLMGHLYRYREAAISGVSITEVPLGVTALCAPFRRMVLG